MSKFKGIVDFNVDNFIYSNSSSPHIKTSILSYIGPGIDSEKLIHCYDMSLTLSEIPLFLWLSPEHHPMLPKKPSSFHLLPGINNYYPGSIIVHLWWISGAQPQSSNSKVTVITVSLYFWSRWYYNKQHVFYQNFTLTVPQGSFNNYASKTWQELSIHLPLTTSSGASLPFSNQ